MRSSLSLHKKVLIGATFVLGLVSFLIVRCALLPVESHDNRTGDFRALPSDETQKHLTSVWEAIVQGYFRTPSHLRLRESLSLYLSESLLVAQPFGVRETIDNYTSRFIENISCNSIETECLIRDRWVGVTREVYEQFGESVRNYLQEHSCEDLVISASLSKQRGTWKLTNYVKTCVILEIPSTLPTMTPIAGMEAR